MARDRGESEHSLILVNVTGNYKPGRVTATVTDLVVPATGLAISIQRTYDSLNAATSGDFGYGWNLGINVNLSVGPDGSVTFTLGGQRRTFYLTPQPMGSCRITPRHSHRSQASSERSRIPLPAAPMTSTSWFLTVHCGSASMAASTTRRLRLYRSSGTSYTISASGGLQGIQDRSGNGLTITRQASQHHWSQRAFVRDSQNRITQITDPTATSTPTVMTHMDSSTASLIQHATVEHLHLHADRPLLPLRHGFRNNPLPVTAYYDSTTDNGNTELDGRLLSVQDAVGNTTSYAYNLSSASIVDGVSVLNTGVTTITYPNSGIATLVYDSYGMLLSSTDQMATPPQMSMTPTTT